MIQVYSFLRDIDDINEDVFTINTIDAHGDITRNYAKKPGMLDM